MQNKQLTEQIETLKTRIDRLDDSNLLSFIEEGSKLLEEITNLGTRVNAHDKRQILAQLAKELQLRLYDKTEIFYPASLKPYQQIEDQQIDNFPKASTLDVRRPSWKFPPSPFRPTLPDTPLGRQLGRYSPFQTARAEDELSSFLFGKPEGFWSGHPLFQMVANRPEAAEIIIGPTGAGKTAFAHGLAQASEAVNSHPYNILPVYIPGHQAVSPHIRQRLNRAIRQFIEANPALYSAQWTIPEEETWLDAVPDILDRLDFNQVLLLIDFNEHNPDLLDQCLDHLDKWRASGLVAKLFVPDSAAEQLSGLPIETNQLGWTEPELREMAEWRFDSVVRKINAPHLKLEFLFDSSDIYGKFLISGLGNPGRLARLWNRLVEMHRQETPDRYRFTSDNLVRAVEQTQ